MCHLQITGLSVLIASKLSSCYLSNSIMAPEPLPLLRSLHPPAPLNPSVIHLPFLTPPHRPLPCRPLTLQALRAEDRKGRRMRTKLWKVSLEFGELFPLLFYFPASTATAIFSKYGRDLLNVFSSVWSQRETSGFFTLFYFMRRSLMRIRN